MLDRRIDYILGYSDDATSPKLLEEVEQSGDWETQSEPFDIFRQYIGLDAIRENECKCSYK